MNEPAKRKSAWPPLNLTGGDSLDGDLLKRLEMKREAQIEMWRRNTTYGSFAVWPWWAVGWCVGFVVTMVRGLWWNLANGYKRWTTHWTDEWQHPDDH